VPEAWELVREEASAEAAQSTPAVGRPDLLSVGSD
jgi:hypothetical protein